MSLGTKSGAVPYCFRTINERERTKEDYVQYMKRTLEKAVITENDLETEEEHLSFACNINFGRKNE